MKRFITSDEITALLREGRTEVVLGVDDQITDLANEIIKRRGLKIVREDRQPAPRAAAPAPDQISMSPIYAPAAFLSPAPAQSAPLKAAEQPRRTIPQPPAAPAVPPKAVYDLLIKNGTVVLPEVGCVRLNVCVKDGKIASLTTQTPSAGQEINAHGLYILPGIIDPHTHLGLFAPFDQELVTESKSAVLGGVTTIGTFFNQLGSYLPTIDMLEKKVPAGSRVDMFPHFTLREETQLQELPHYSARGMNSFKVYMCGIPGLFPHQEDGFIVRAMQQLKRLDADPILCIHAENTSIVDYATEDMKDLSVDTLDEWAQSHPNLAEGEAVIRSAYLSKKLSLRTYIVHTSCKESMEALRRIKHSNLFVETTSPYLSLDTSSDAGVYGKMLPPLREPESRQALWDAVRDGIIDTIGTDNTTIRSDEKKAAEGMGAAIAGYPALGTHLVSVLNEGIFKQEIPLDKLVPLMTMNPAKIFRLYPQKGTLVPGADADLVLVDLNSSKTVDPAKLESRSDFSIFQGKTLRGWPCATIKSGHIVAWNGKLTDDAACGRVLKHCMKE